MRILYDESMKDIENDMKATNCSIVYERKEVNTKAYDILLDESELIQSGVYVRIPGYDPISIYFSSEDMKTILEDNKKYAHLPIQERFEKNITLWFNSLVEKINKANTTNMKYANDESYTEALNKILE